MLLFSLVILVFFLFPTDCGNLPQSAVFRLLLNLLFLSLRCKVLFMELELFDMADYQSQNPETEDNRITDTRQSLDIKKILQPKTVTYAKYRFSKIHNLMFIHIREELQLYITSHKEDINKTDAISVPLFVNHYPHFRGNTVAMFKSASEMMVDKCNLVSFEWQYNPEYHAELLRWMRRGIDLRSRGVFNPQAGEKIHQSSLLITDVMYCENDPGKILVFLNPNLLPFLLYYGRGVGGTYFDRDVALRLRSRYSFRLYEYIMDWSTSTDVKVVSLTELKDLIVFPDSYDVNDIRNRVLNVAKDEIEAAGSPLCFDFEFKYDSTFGGVPGKRGAYPKNCVVFTLHKKEFVDYRDLTRKQLVVMLQGIADREKLYLCVDVAERSVSSGVDAKLKSKFFYYDKKVASGKMSVNEYKNTLLKIVRELTGTDLRSDSHIRNSVKASKKYISSGNEPKLLFD